MHQSTPHIKTASPGEQDRMLLCPTGGFGVSICPYCSPAWGNLRPLDQTRAKMNSDVEHLKKPFGVFFFGYESSSVCLKACVRPSQCPTWQRLCIIKRKPKGCDNNSKFKFRLSAQSAAYLRWYSVYETSVNIEKEQKSFGRVWPGNLAQFVSARTLHVWFLKGLFSNVFLLKKWNKNLCFFNKRVQIKLLRDDNIINFDLNHKRKNTKGWAKWHSSHKYENPIFSRHF